VSAFILDDDHIDLLVTAGLMGVGLDAKLRVYVDGGLVEFNRHEDADHLGLVLKTANYESVNYRYKESEQVTPYKYVGNGITNYIGGEIIPWGQVLQAIRCYEYQSCEHPTWEGSLAKAVCDAITHKVCARISSECDAEWVWSRSHALENMNAVRERLAVAR
jgi:hypothetical protein